MLNTDPVILSAAAAAVEGLSATESQGGRRVLRQAQDDKMLNTDPVILSAAAAAVEGLSAAQPQSKGPILTENGYRDAA